MLVQKQTLIPTLAQDLLILLLTLLTKGIETVAFQSALFLFEQFGGEVKCPANEGTG